MDFTFEKLEKYAKATITQALLNKELASQIEKSVAGVYSGEGMINYIFDISLVKNLDIAATTLIDKVNKLCKRESGLLVVVTINDDVIDQIFETTEKVLILPTTEEALDAIYMNELENEFKDEAEDDEYGFEGGGESDY
jgi:anti-anti-sigma regulatory factor